MTSFFLAIFFLPLSSLAAAANFTQVFVWPDNLDYEWPSEAVKKQVLQDGTFKLENIHPRYMAVYGSRLFLSLHKNDEIPVTLVTLPTSSASSEPPKLTPFPSWDIHGKEGDCDKIEKARGLQVDSIGRLWVLDEGSYNCSSKIWIIELSNKDETKLIHRFRFYQQVHELILDETPNGTFAYISNDGVFDEDSFVVFSVEMKESWIVDTPRVRAYSIALSPKKDQLYLGKWNSNELYSISVAALRNGTETANPELIGNWIGSSQRMLMDNHGIMFAAFWGKNYISSFDTSKPFGEQRFYEVAGLNGFSWPFTFALDRNGTFWMTVYNWDKKPSYRLLKTAVGAKPYIFDSSRVKPAPAAIPMTTNISAMTKPTPLTSSERSSTTIPTTTDKTSIQIQKTTEQELNRTTPPTAAKHSTRDEKNASTEVQECSNLTAKLHQHRLFIVILICSNVLTVILFSLIILRHKRKNCLLPNRSEAHQMILLNNVDSRSLSPDF